MSKDLAAKLRRRRNLKLRFRRRRQLTRIAFTCFLAGFLVAVLFTIYNSEFWNIRKISVIGNHHYSDSEVIKIAAVAIGSNILKLPVKKVKERFSQPWIEKVTLVRKLPSELVIKVKEVKPVSILATGRTQYLLDKTGLVIDRQKEEKAKGLPVINLSLNQKIVIGKTISDRRVTEALKVLTKVNHFLGKRISFVSVPMANRLSFYTNDKLEVVFGPARQIDRKIAIINQILRKSAQKIIYIDVSDPSSPPAVRKLNASPGLSE